MRTQHKFVGAVVALTASIALVGSASAAVVYQDSFSRPATFVSGSSPDVLNTPAATWVSNARIDGGNRAVFDAPGLGDGNTRTGAYLPFTPQSGFVYTLSANLEDYGGPSGEWIALGFTSSNGLGSFTSNSPSPWMLFRNTGGIQTFGTGSSFSGFSNGSLFAVQLNTMAPLWTASFFVNGVQQGSTYTYGVNPTISFVGVGTAGNTLGIADNFTLDAVGVPEPSTVLLLGLGGLLIMRRSRKA